jgi:putative salt-induced outer membrane protein
MRRLLVLGLMISANTWADEAQKEHWQGNIDVGYISSMGTTSGSKDTFRGKISATHTGEYWVNILSAEGIGVRDDIPTTNDTERYLLNLKSRHFFAEYNFFTLRAQWEKDLLSASEYQLIASLGLGREIIKTEAHHLKIETGLGTRHNELHLHAPNRETIGLLSWDYDWKINPNTKFIHKGTIESGDSNVVTRVTTQLRQNITKVIALTVSHDYKHDNGDINKREGLMSVGLNYQF